MKRKAAELAAFLLLLGGQAWAAGTPADTPIVNAATATYRDSIGTTRSVNSNPTLLRVDELLGVTIVSNDVANIPVTSSDDDDLLGFTITNVGNGSEPYRLLADSSLAGDDYDPTDTRVYLDGNGNGVLEAGIDPLYQAGVNDPVLPPDQSIVIFVSNDTPAALPDGDIGLSRLAVTAVTGSGPPGTTFPGQGSGGTDAVVGITTATGATQGGYVVKSVVVDLAKTQAVADPFGGTNPVQGAVITYTLTLTLGGIGSIGSTVTTDPIPANTTYVADSLRLNASALTDITDADPGRFTGSGIEVSLGTLAAPSSQTVTFQVRIN